MFKVDIIYYVGEGTMEWQHRACMRLAHHLSALDQKQREEGKPDYTNSKPTPSVIFPSVMVYFLNFPESSLIAPPSGN